MSYHGGNSRGRKYGRGRYFKSSGNRDDFAEEGGERCGSGGRGRGSRPPAGLKGREIGMWYRQKSLAKKKQAEVAQRPKVEMDSQREEQISKLLEDIETENITDSDSSEDCSEAASQITDPARTYYSKPLIKNYAIDRKLKEELNNKRVGNRRYKEMQKFREKLPTYKMREEVLELIKAHQVCVISGETGCGKTTQVAQFILDEYIDNDDGSLCKIVCTQPRRISAVSVAERVADERGETVGGGMTVGYQIRLESRLPRQQGSITYCTTGILLRWLLGDRMLKGVSHIILDEVHERNIVSDFLIIILRDLLPCRPELKLILMSATLNAGKFSSYYGDCPMMTIPGFTFPVTEYWLEDVLQHTGFRLAPSHRSRQKGRPYHWRFIKGKRISEEEKRKEEEYERRFPEYMDSIKDSYPTEVLDGLQNLDEEEINVDLIVALIQHIVLHCQDGAILVFVPGWSDISKVHETLQRNTMFKSGKFIIIPLHSLMPTVNQKQVFDRPPAGVRKIIIATNIAETSITIDDVVHVIDTGKSKESNYDVKNNLRTLKPEWISKAAAVQRRGRAGRVQQGYCYHLFTQLRADLMEAHQLPEMLRTPLEEVCLQIRLLKLGQIEEFICKSLDCPDLKAVQHAKNSLLQLNAMDSDENLTPLGYHLARLPVEPHIGKMILFGAIFCCLDPVLTIAASLSFKDPFIIPIGKEKDADYMRKVLSEDTKSDHLMLVNAFKGWEDAKSLEWRAEKDYCWENFLSMNTLKLLNGMKTQFCEYLCDIGLVESTDCKQPAANKNADNLNLIRAVVCAGLYPNVAKIDQTGKKHKPPRLFTKTDGRVNLHQKSVNAGETDLQGKWLVYHQKIKSTGVYLHDSSVVHPIHCCSLVVISVLALMLDKMSSKLMTGSFSSHHQE
ncbi:ATP-dependent DNA/RNA helicase DHX36-like isoform X1 [Ptychodera flava]|uniref:ATP-dependent DNA/RNA helicase DHX36-like isoform X1 n=1 Tax=Ptychodera flava TaxID=63121 RepID=UPI00396A07D6